MVQKTKKVHGREEEGTCRECQTKRTRSHHPLVPPVDQIVPVELYPVPGHALPVGVVGDVADDGEHILGFDDIGVFEHFQIPK